MATPDRVIVVGGGLAGLIAARRLALNGSEVTVLEASHSCGGQLSRHTVGGIPLDAGADSYETRGGTVGAVATALHLGDDIVAPSAAPMSLFRADGTSVPVPATSILGIPGVPLAADVVEAIGLPSALRAQLDALMLGQFGFGSRTLGELVRRRMGRGVLEELVGPVVRGLHGSSPDEFDLERSAPELLRAFRRETNLAAAVRAMVLEPVADGPRTAGIRGGLTRLIDALVAELDRFGVELRTGVTVTTAENSGVRLSGGEWVAGTVVVAAPGITEPAPVGTRATVVTLVLDAPELDPARRASEFVVASNAAPGARALTRVNAKWPWVADLAGGRHVLRLSYDGDPIGTQAAAVDGAVRDAALLLGVPIGAPDDAAIVTWERAAPRTHAVDGMRYVGEAVTGTGIAAVVAQADAASVDRPDNDTEPWG